METDVVTIETGTEIDDQLQGEVNDLVAAANAMVVDSLESYDESHAIASGLKEKYDRITEFFESMRKAAHDAKQLILDKRNAARQPAEFAIPIIKKKMTSFSQEQEKKRREEEDRQRKIAEEVAVKERTRLDKIAEEAAEKDDEIAFEQAKFEAEQVTAESQMAVSQPAPKPKGYVQNWQARVVDKRKLLKAALEETRFDWAVIADEKKLTQFAKTTKGTSPIPGVVFEDKGTVRLS